MATIIKTLFLCCFVLLLPLQKAYATDSVTYSSTIIKQIEADIAGNNFDSVFKRTRSMLTNKNLSQAEKIDILDYCFEYARNLGIFSESGEMYELAYTMEGLDKNLVQAIHTKLSDFYYNARLWNKAIDTHFYYLQNVKVSDAEKREILFSIVQNYNNLLQYEKSERVLAEILKIAKDDIDFAKVFFEQGKIYFATNNYKKAIRFYEKALSFNVLKEEEKGIALYNMGLSHEILGDFEKALQSYKQAKPFYKNKMVIMKRIENIKSM